MSDIGAFERRVMSSLSGKLRERLRQASDSNIDVAALGDPEQIAEAMAAVLPLGHIYDEISGPFYDTAGLTHWLGITRQALHQKVARHAVLACPLAERGSVYPAWQFQANGATIPGLGDVLDVLAAATNDAWMAALWMRAPNDGLDGQRPSQWLTQGRGIESVLVAARHTAAAWAA